jgi:hypothetical protein
LFGLVAYIVISEDRDSVAIAVLTRDVATLGKNNEIVNVNIPASLIPVIEFILKLRRLIRVPPQNPFIFAKPNSPDEYRNSYPFFHRMANSCGADNPHLLSSQGLRRAMCTEAEA